MATRTKGLFSLRLLFISCLFFFRFDCVFFSKNKKFVIIVECDENAHSSPGMRGSGENIRR